MKRKQAPVKGLEERELNQDPQRLKRRRVAERLSLKDLAAKASCSEAYLSQLEHGKYSASPRMLGAIADALGCKTTDLMPPDTKAAA